MLSRMVVERLFRKIVATVGVLRKYFTLTSVASERLLYVPGSGQQTAFIKTRSSHFTDCKKITKLLGLLVGENFLAKESFQIHTAIEIFYSI
jgi:hypothetical protein